MNIKPIQILSWNVNGLRSLYKKGFLDWFLKQNPDILCIQETKANEVQLPKELIDVKGYYSYFASAERKGYSGVGLYTKSKPQNIRKEFGIKKIDGEGRTLIADYGDFILLNIYFPNGKASSERLKYKLDFYEQFLTEVDRLKKQNKKIIACGDVNTAHKEIDLSRPKENEKFSGFLHEERAWIDKWISHGYFDTFRMFNQESGQYTWWDLKTRARERNVGWRIDYFFVSENLKNSTNSAFILSDVMGSDHCPIGLEVEIRNE